MNEVECGLACLAMIFSYHGRKTSVSELRTMYGVSRDGLSALSLVKAARSTGMIARAISLQQNDFKNVTLPAIIHWQFNHFLVVERWTPTKVSVIDPAIGRRSLTAEEFSSGFTGIVMMFEPGLTFERRPKRPTLTLQTICPAITPSGTRSVTTSVVSLAGLSGAGTASPLSDQDDHGSDYPL